MFNRKVRAAFLMIGLLAVVGCGRSPTATVKEFTAAAKNNDTDKMKTYLSKQTLSTFGPLLDMMKSPGANKSDSPMDLGDVEVKSETISGDTATVTAVTTKKDGTKSSDEQVHLVKEGGEWKIDFEMPKFQVPKFEMPKIPPTVFQPPKS